MKKQTVIIIILVVLVVAVIALSVLGVIGPVDSGSFAGDIVRNGDPPTVFVATKPNICPIMDNSEPTGAA